MEPQMITAMDLKTNLDKNINDFANTPRAIINSGRPMWMDIEDFEKRTGRTLSYERKQAIASLAIENMHVTEEDIILFERVDRMGLSPDEEVSYIMEYTLNSFKGKEHG